MVHSVTANIVAAKPVTHHIDTLAQSRKDCMRRPTHYS